VEVAPSTVQRLLRRAGLGRRRERLAYAHREIELLPRRVITVINPSHVAAPW
jgi:hypothetical protein